jgi:tetratricopeptide (TPR) repeat protein
MTILQKYNYNSLTDKDKAFYGLVYMQIRDKNLLPLEPDSLLEFSLKYYLDTHNDHEKLATCYLYKGKQFKNIQDYAKAIECYLYSSDLIQDNENYELIGKLFFEQGYINAVQGEYKLARLKLNRSIQYFKISNSANPAFLSAIYIGWSFHEECLYEEAIKYYKSFKNNINDSLQKGVLWQEIAGNYYKLKQYDSAKYYLTEVLNYPYLEKNKAKRYSMMADLCFDIRQVDSAIYYSNKTLLYKTGITTRRNIYRILSNSYSLKGNAYYAREFMSKYQDCTDSIRKIDSQTKGSYIENMHNTQKNAEKSRSWIWYLSVFVFLIIAFSILLYVRKHKKNVLEMKIAQEKQIQQKAELRQEVVAKSRKAVETTIKERRDEVMSNLKNNNPEFRRKLLNKLYGEVIHFNDKIYFKKEMDAIMNNLYSKLESRYPELKEKEIQWACLYELNVSRDDIMDLLDFNLESYKKMRQRFAQKTGVQYIKSIDDLLENILTE